jgi:hypothetical protein
MKNLETIKLETLTSVELENTNGGCSICYEAGAALVRYLKSFFE